MDIGYSIARKKKIALTTAFILSVFALLFLLIPHHQSFELPKAILELRLTQELRGKQAQEIVDALHKKSVTPEESIIGTYFSTNGSAKLYVSFYDSRTIADEQFYKMVNSIRKGEIAFSHFRELQVQNIKVYLCLGLGQAHYFFLHEKELYWWAVDLQIAQASMQELVRIVKGSAQK